MQRTATPCTPVRFRPAPPKPLVAYTRSRFVKPTIKNPLDARVVKLVYTGDLKSPDRKIVPVQVRPRAPFIFSKIKSLEANPLRPTIFPKTLKAHNRRIVDISITNTCTSIFSIISTQSTWFIQSCRFFVPVNFPLIPLPLPFKLQTERYDCGCNIKNKRLDIRSNSFMIE